MSLIKKAQLSILNSSGTWQLQQQVKYTRIPQNTPVIEVYFSLSSIFFFNDFRDAFLSLSNSKAFYRY